MKGIWSNQIAYAILFVIVIFVGTMIFAPKLFAVVKPILGIGNDNIDTPDMITVNQTFVNFMGNLNKCGNFKGDCKCFKDVSSLPSNYKINFNENKAILLNKDKAVINEINIINKVSCVVINKNNVIDKSSIDASFSLDFSKASKIMADYSQNSKVKNKEFIIFYKFSDNSLCLITNELKNIKLIETKPYCI